MIFTNFTLPAADGVTLVEIGRLNPRSERGRADLALLLRCRRQARAVLLNNPATVELAMVYLLKLTGALTAPVLLFDLILKAPGTSLERVIAAFKSVFLRRIEHIVAIHRDTSGYQAMYGLSADCFAYVPFKANNFDQRTRFAPRDGRYVVALGGSQRDYSTFIAAVAGLPLDAVIVCSDANAAEHNADVGIDAHYPANLRRIRHRVSQDEWNRFIAESSFVVVPIRRTAIQPAGVSVYLEAMALGKAVVVTEGASVNGILEDGVNALIVPAGDAAGLRAAIERLAFDLPLRESLARAGHAYALSLGNDQRLREQLRDLVLQLSAAPPAKKGQFG